MDSRPGRNDVLAVVDVQNDFRPGGALAVPGGDEVVPVIDRISERFEHVVLTQDWHPAGHLSFASSHEGTQPYETVEASNGSQILWPDHCVQGTRGAEIHPELDAGCVMYSALDGRRLGFEVVVIEAACRGIDLEGSLETAWRAMHEAGVERMEGR